MLQATSKKKIVRFLFVLCILFKSIYGLTPDSHSQISYFLQSRQFPAAIWTYQKKAYLDKRHDQSMLEKIAMAILEEGMESSDIPKKLIAYYSMIACSYIPTLPQLEIAIRARHPGLQVAAIQLLKEHTEDRSEEILKQGLTSPFPIIQLTTAYVLAQKKFPKAYPLIESLLFKVPPAMHIYFPEFFATLNTLESKRRVIQFINDREEKIRISAIISSMQHKIEEALPYIQSMLTHANPIEQEACLFALSHMNDTTSLSRMKSLVLSACDEVTLASSFALYTLGYHEYYGRIINLAQTENLFAIALLGFIPESRECLFRLLKNANFTVQMNAAMALLKLRDSRCVPVIMEILQAANRGTDFVQVTSQGGCMQYIKPLAKNNRVDEKEQRNSVNILENLLLQSSELTQSDFLSIAKFLFDSNYSTLIPLAVQLLENLQTPEAIELLECGVSKLGSPLLRGYSQIALFKLGKCSLSSNFHQFLQKSLQISLVNYEEVRNKKNIGIFTLQPEEKLRLVLTSLQVIASESSEESIDTLLQCIINSHELNRYVLAGLLLQCIQ